MAEDWARALARAVRQNNPDALEGAGGPGAANARARSLIGRRGSRTVSSKGQKFEEPTVEPGFFARRKARGFPDMPEGNQERYIASMLQRGRDPQADLDAMALRRGMGPESIPPPMPVAAPPAMAGDGGGMENLSLHDIYANRGRKLVRQRGGR